MRLLRFIQTTSLLSIQLCGVFTASSCVLHTSFPPVHSFTLSRQRKPRRRLSHIAMTSSNAPNATVEAVSPTWSTEQRLHSILQECSEDILTENLTFGARENLENFLQQQVPGHKRKFDDVSGVPSRSSLADAATRVANSFCEMAARTDIKKVTVRRSLEQASLQLLAKSATGTKDGSLPSAGVLPAALVGMALAVRHQSDRQYSRAAASAIASALSRTKERDGRLAACCVVQALVVHTANRNALDEMLRVDCHVVTSLSRALKMDGSEHPETRTAVSTLVSKALCLNSIEELGFDLLPEKTVVASALALAAQLRPWEQLSPVQLIEAAVPFDLWHAAERVCASVASSMGEESPVTLEAVKSLIGEALQARTYRRADTFATQFYSMGGKSLFLEARLLHACDTIAKVVQKHALPVIERQISRIDKSAERVLNDGVADEKEVAKAKEEIRTFALQQLEETGNVDAAHRLANIYELSYVYDEETVKKAVEARRKKYLQWEDVLPGSPPELISKPADLLAAFSALPDGGLFGFDVEWSDDDAGAALLQIALPNNTVLLIDIPALSMTLEGAKALENTVGRLFVSSSATVVGFGCRQDASKLRASPCLRDVHWFKGATAVVDLQRLIEEKEPVLRGLGLSKACEQYLGKPLDKSEQCSFWSVRPLSVQQRTYAALDAWACLAIHQKEFPR